MPRESANLFALNRGEVSRLALMRVDQEKLRLAAFEQINIQPHALGPGTLRPGMQYIGEVAGSNPNRIIEFVYASDDTALVELTGTKMRVWVDDALVTRVSTSSTIQAFASWTTSASTGSTVTKSGNITISNVTRGNTSYAYGTMTIAGGDTAKEHALRVTISKGPVKFKVGTSQGADDVFRESSLDRGVHSLAFTPGATTVYVQIDASMVRSAVVDSISVESSGTMEITTPWAEADLPAVQYDQSADVIYVACSGYEMRKIERRSTTSWSLVYFDTEDGPFPTSEFDTSISVTPSALNGDITLTSSRSVFKSTDVGALVRLFHTGQNTNNVLAANATFGDPVRVSGSNRAASTLGDPDRTFRVTLSGTWSGTIALQSSVEGPDTGFVDFKLYTGNVTGDTINDSTPNAIIWYRLGFKSGGYTSGSVTTQISFQGGGGAGIARITGYTSGTSVSAQVVGRMYGTVATTNWRFGDWGARKGYPACVALHEGRLWAGGNSRIWGSVSDDFQSFDFESTGNDATIQRSIGRGPIANINWLLSLARLCVGADSGVATARSNSIDEPLTATNVNLKYSFNQGVDALRAVSVDTKGVLVQRAGRRVYMMVFSSQDFDYKPIDLTRLNPDIGVPGFNDISVQRQPDTHIRLPLNDGKMACFLYDEDDEIYAWWRIETDGEIEQIAVLPEALEDAVYVTVKRTINGNTKRYLEKFVRLDECRGDTTSKLADSHIVYSGSATTTLSGLSHLEGESVIVWGDGAEMGFNASSPSTIATYTVSSGSITVPTAVSNAVIGLPYTGRFVSCKLAYAGVGTAVNKKKKVNSIGFVLDNTHYQGVRFGHYRENPAESKLYPLPLVERGKETATGTVHSSYDQEVIPFPGQWDTDSRLQIEMRAPRPATVLGITIDVTTTS